MTLVLWICRLAAAALLLQTLYFKFTASAESVYIFTTVGMEPVGRIGVGVLELIAGVLLLITSRAWMGAALALGLMAGAIFLHLTVLGIEVMDDGGQLFIYALVVSGCAAMILWQEREKIKTFLQRLRS